MKTLNDLISGIKTSQSEIALSLANGNAPTWEAYQRMVGEYRGLQSSLDILNNLLREDDEHE
jgi:hypothetical protein